MISLFGRSIAAIDYDSTRIRVLEFRRDRSGSVKIVRAFNEALPADLALTDAEAFAQFLTDLFAEKGVKTRSVGFAVGREAALLHHFAIPPTGDDDLTNLVRFRLSPELPFAIEETVVDYVVTGRDSRGLATAVLAAAVKREHIDHLRHVARSAGFRIRRIGLGPYSHLPACQAAGLTESGATLFVSLGEKTIEFDVFDAEGGLTFSRSAGLGDVQADLTDRAMLQLQRTLPAYQGDPSGASLAQIVVDGDTGIEDEFLTRAGEQLGLEARRFELPAHAGQESADGMATCYGLAVGQMRSRNRQFDFLSPKRAVDPAARRTRTVQLAVAAAALVMIIAIGYTRGRLSSRQEELASLEEQNKQLGEELREFNKFADQVDDVSEWCDGKVNWLEQLKSLTATLPDPAQVYVTKISFAESRRDRETVLATITIDGHAKTDAAIGQLCEDLKEAGPWTVQRGKTIETGKTEYPLNFMVHLTVVREMAGDRRSGKGAVSSAG